MPTSSEAQHARRMAVYYKQHDALHLDRTGRVAALQRETDRLEEETAAYFAAHKAGCAVCKAGKFCFGAVTWDEAQAKRYDRTERCRSFIRVEKADQKYADDARFHGVEPKHHKDGFCRYWQNLRARRFALNNWRCETPGCEAAAENCHHLHYDTLGYEELDDVRALCRKCHAALHKVPA